MFDRDKWNEILEALTANTFRTILTAFGVFWGIFILVILLAAGNGLENGVKKGFDGIATNTMFMWSQTTSKPFKGLPATRQFDFKNVDVTALKENFPDLLYVSPRNQLGGFEGANNVVRGTKTAAYTIYGDYPELIKQESMDIIKGRFVNQQDIVLKRKVAVIGQGVISEMYEKAEEVIGTYIKINGVNFMVVGVYNSKSRNNGDAESAQKNIFMPFTTFQQAFNYGDTVGWMALTANDDASITELKPKILDFMKSRHSIHPQDDRAIGNFDLFQEFSKIQGLFLILRFIAYFVGTLVLLSGVIGISNIMLIVVKERTKEIGIRRALGATPGAIRSQILSEAIFLTIIAGMFGIALATGLLAVLNMVLESMPSEGMMFANPSVDLTVVFIALFILIGSGLLAGLIPAQTAINVKPVDALRTE
ncbi:MULTISPECIES: ABC transporter permease [Flavobacterium]|jgi:putative ABC transport system permease protein|uniref:ABC transporter permease n=1 Tax=Flavobacterium algoritolerans TaxID=3041254 RepID=A0ABT6V651_9FLAO|nr:MULTISPECIES: ABC transporter permease [Flavobacterium]MDI5886687.1 ABC transporter permease [Flavobacterium yafengii]MDI5893701.1 ABC transporter permease [Flavobacterium algoritolerans]PIF61726.1 putative ABC transport system permease protein [Flavobacterium sp. 11]RKS15342.1 putative ABC transport system permease protein [Flavobacterium sp. 120]WKL42828.1 ABC transporter permease [Flavobacterium sp. ZE23DGlu08]